MTTLVYATWDDVVANAESVIPDTQRTRVEGFIRRASSRLNSYFPWLPVKYAAGQIDPELPMGIVIESVMRIYRNPMGLTNQTVGPFAMNFGGGTDGQHDVVYIDREEAAAILEGALDLGLGVGSFRVAHAGPESPLEALETAPVLDAYGSYSQALLEALRRHA